ncbi:MAG: nickel pincer cofactor biosynthesis protein LarB [Acidobacteria bacterium]|nr:nickel pincer cofactor biosynthesis protein LarB [Acidobacteriota bacterium]
MNLSQLRSILTDLEAGRISVDQALDRFKLLPYEDLGFARVDHHRALRHGFPEVVLGTGKTPDQVAAIVSRLLLDNDNVLITRSGPEIHNKVREVAPEAEFHPQARAITVLRDKTIYGIGSILLITAGTSDIPVAEEAAITARAMGNTVETLYDVGVAGIHRLFSERERLSACRVIIVVAGMEGALPSIVGGLVGVPVIAVPSSVGYGSSFGGLTALLGMLNSCASNVAVVNIDNGFGAGYIASLINRKTS